jgi:putative flippase GtrA
MPTDPTTAPELRLTGPWPGVLLGAWSTHRHAIGRLVRYAAVSAVATVTSLTVLGLTVGVLGLAAVWSNVIATAIGTVPSFELNRRWVWTPTGGRRWLGQVIPFCALAFAGLVISTVAVGIASSHTTGWSRLGHTVAVEGANIAAYGALWVIQYFLLDRVLFRSTGADVDGRGGAPTFSAGGQTPHRGAEPAHPMVVAPARRRTIPTRGGNDHVRT